jgi:Flp pilus assembly protein CpaB
MAGRRYTFVFYIALVIAAVATFGVYRVLENTKASSRIATRSLVVAVKDLPEGTSIDRTVLSVREWPVAAIPAGAFSSPDSLIGRVTRVAVFTGEPLVPGRLAPAGTGPGIEVKITPGKRAMGVRINDVAGVSGLMQPNSRVDVLVNINRDNGNGQRVSKLFMENMRVLSVGTRVERDAEGKPIEAATATLEVTPEEAERLAIASRLRRSGQHSHARCQCRRRPVADGRLAGAGSRRCAPRPCTSCCAHSSPDCGRSVASGCRAASSPRLAHGDRVPR